MNTLPVDPKAPTLFRLNAVPVKVRPASWAQLIFIWSGLALLAGKRRLRRSWPARLLAGALTLPVALLPDLAHI
jgi:hypothetical protein